MKSIFFILVLFCFFIDVGQAQTWQSAINADGKPIRSYRLTQGKDLVEYRGKLVLHGEFIFADNKKANYLSLESAGLFSIQGPTVAVDPKRAGFAFLYSDNKNRMVGIYETSGPFPHTYYFYEYKGNDNWKFLDTIPADVLQAYRSEDLSSDLRNIGLYNGELLFTISDYPTPRESFDRAYRYKNGQFSSLIDTSINQIKFFGEHNGTFWSSSFLGDMNGQPCIPGPCTYDGVRWQSFAKSSNIDEYSLVRYNNTWVVMGGDFLFGNDLSPMRRVKLWTGTEWLPIGDVNFRGEGKLLVHKNELYAVGRTQDDKGFACKYNGVVWEALSKDSIDGPVYNAIVYRDELYIQGDFEKIGSTNFKGIARMPLLNPINASPVDLSETYTLNEDAPDTLHIKDNASDINGDYLYCKIVQNAKHGTVQLLATDEFYYTSATDYNGLDSITYSLCDRGGLCDTAKVLLTIVAVNDTPVANIDSVLTFQDQSVVVHPLHNDVDAEQGTLKLHLIGNPVSGTATLQEDSIIFTPFNGFVGNDLFQYATCDEENACDTASVYVQVKEIDPNAITEGLDQESISVYPNPAQDVLRVQLPSGKQSTITLNDLQGRLVHKVTAKGLAIIRIDHLKGGMYFLHVQSENSIQIHKITKL